MTDKRRLPWATLSRGGYQRGLEVLLFASAPFGLAVFMAVLARLSGRAEFEGVSIPKVLGAAWQAVRDPAVLKHLYGTGYVAAKGFVGGCMAAGVVGLVLGYLPGQARFMIVALNALRSIPLTLLIPFLGIAPLVFVLPPGVTSDLPSKDPAWLVAVGAALYVMIGMADGIEERSADREAIFRRVVRFGRVKYLFRVLIPEAMPKTLTAGRLAVLFSLVLTIVLEPLLSYPGVGKYIFDTMNDVNFVNDLASKGVGLILVVGLFGVLIDGMYRGFQRLVLQWRGGE